MRAFVRDNLQQRRAFSAGELGHCPFSSPSACPFGKFAGTVAAAGRERWYVSGPAASVMRETLTPSCVHVDARDTSDHEKSISA
jgi:hypothetical protein